jgi:hypothetical protein
MTRKLFAAVVAAASLFIAGTQVGSQRAEVPMHAVRGEPVRLTPIILQTINEIFNEQKEKALRVEPKSFKVGEDGYYFEGAQYYPKTDFKVRVVYETPEEIHRDMHDDTIVAYSYIPTARNHWTCEIHMIDPRHQYWPAYIGHEFTHCLVGNFHPMQDRYGKYDPYK